ncbi:unnamed protein product [Amoebophrya sp. A120]|nr:unnamed protein product [Amoebophrya sp. A120]|eukprot:GSA120T00022759001.1
MDVRTQVCAEDGGGGVVRGPRPPLKTYLDAHVPAPFGSAFSFSSSSDSTQVNKRAYSEEAVSSFSSGKKYTRSPRPVLQTCADLQRQCAETYWRFWDHEEQPGARDIMTTARTPEEDQQTSRQRQPDEHDHRPPLSAAGHDDHAGGPRDPPRRPILFDLIIDDGFHSPRANLASLSFLWPYLGAEPLGRYVVEDLTMPFTHVDENIGKVTLFLENMVKRNYQLWGWRKVEARTPQDEAENFTWEEHEQPEETDKFVFLPQKTPFFSVLTSRTSGGSVLILDKTSASEQMIPSVENLDELAHEMELDNILDHKKLDSRSTSGGLRASSSTSRIEIADHDAIAPATTVNVPLPTTSSSSANAGTATTSRRSLESGSTGRAGVDPDIENLHQQHKNLINHSEMQGKQVEENVDYPAPGAPVLAAAVRSQHKTLYAPSEQAVVPRGKHVDVLPTGGFAEIKDDDTDFAGSPLTEELALAVQPVDYENFCWERLDGGRALLEGPLRALQKLPVTKDYLETSGYAAGVLTPALLRDPVMLRKLQQGLLTAVQARHAIYVRLERQKVVHDLLRGQEHHTRYVLGLRGQEHHTRYVLGRAQAGRAGSSQDRNDRANKGNAGTPSTSRKDHRGKIHVEDDREVERTVLRSSINEIATADEQRERQRQRAAPPELVVESAFLNSTELLLDLRRQSRFVAKNRTFANCCGREGPDLDCFRSQYSHKLPQNWKTDSWTYIYRLVAHCCIPETIRRTAETYVYPYLNIDSFKK